MKAFAVPVFLTSYKPWRNQLSHIEIVFCRTRRETKSPTSGILP